jgi:hypothetical protein
MLKKTKLASRFGGLLVEDPLHPLDGFGFDSGDRFQFHCAGIHDRADGSEAPEQELRSFGSNRWQRLQGEKLCSLFLSWILPPIK